MRPDGVAPSTSQAVIASPRPGESTAAAYGLGVHYDEVIAMAFDAPGFEGVPTPTLEPSAARRLRDAIEPLAMHAVWSRRTNEALAERGLDFFGSYVWGRATALGTPSPSVVTATFAVFEPTVIAGVYETALATCDRQTVLAIRAETVAASLADTLRGEDPGEVGAIADAIFDAVEGVDGLGRPLFAGLRDQGRPEDPFARLWRAGDLIREHRGDGHVAVCTARGLDAVEMNVLTELWLGMPYGTYSATRFWPAERLEAAADALRGRGWMDGEHLTAAGRAVRQQIEDDTDALEVAIVRALDDALPRVVDRCATWSAACVEARLFPPDPFKRAAG